MRRVVYREVGGKRRRRRSTARKAVAAEAGFGRMISRLISASLMLETSKRRR